MKKRLVTLLLAGIMVISTCATSLASIVDHNTTTQKEKLFLTELERAIESSNVLESKNYEVAIVAGSARSNSGQIVLANVQDIISYLEEQELAHYQENVEIITLDELTRSASDVTKTIKYTREFVTKYVFTAKIKVNETSGIISQVSSPRLTVTGGLGISIENQTYNTDIIDNTVAYVECDYTSVSKIKIPGVTDIEIKRKDYRTYMYYRYDEVYDYGNEEL